MQLQLMLNSGKVLFFLFHNLFYLKEGEFIMNTNYHQMMRIKKITATAMLCAIAYVVAVFVKLPVQFLTLDFKDSLIILCSLLFGPISGISMAVIVPFLEFLTISSTGIYGLIMNVLSSVTVSLTAGLIYRYKKTMVGAVIGLISAVFSVTAVMILANLFITPYYLGTTIKAVAMSIPKLLLPFNFIKAVLNAAIVLLLYKPLSKMLKKLGFIQAKYQEKEFGESKTTGVMRTVLVSSIAAVIIAVSLIIIFFLLA